jgi:chaperonin GroES
MSRGDEREIMNHSGIQPLDLRVLVLPDPVEVKTAGGIILPDQHKEREKYAMQHGTLVAVGENAWEEAASRSSAFVKPQPGDRVVISKYGGTMLTGTDGKEYRLMNDEDVIGRVMGGNNG